MNNTNGMVNGMNGTSNGVRRVVSPKPVENTKGLLERIAELEAENANLRVKTAPKPIKMTVAEAGYVLLEFGNGTKNRYLYADEWERMKKESKELDTFFEANKEKIKDKSK